MLEGQCSAMACSLNSSAGHGTSKNVWDKKQEIVTCTSIHPWLYHQQMGISSLFPTNYNLPMTVPSTYGNVIIIFWKKSQYTNDYTINNVTNKRKSPILSTMSPINGSPWVLDVSQQLHNKKKLKRSPLTGQISSQEPWTIGVAM